MNIASWRHSQPDRNFTCREECLKARGRQLAMPGTAIVAFPSVNLTVTSQASSHRSDDGDTRGRLNASFARMTATTAVSMRYYLSLSERNIVWMTPSTMTRIVRVTRVLRILHSAHHGGVLSMESRARSIAFWTGMTNDIRVVRQHCSACNRSAPSQAATPAMKSPVPSTPFESRFADFF